MIAPAPTICQIVGASESTIQATLSAMSGWRFAYIAVRVGPIVRTPR